MIVLQALTVILAITIFKTENAIPPQPITSFQILTSTSNIQQAIVSSIESSDKRTPQPPYSLMSAK